jgi:UPF0755 protein
MTRRLAGVVASALVLAAAAHAAWIHQTRWPLRAIDAPPQALVVPPGANAVAIGRRLEELGLVRHAFVFRALVWARGAGARLRAGEYSLDGPLSLADIVDLLARGESAGRGLTFPEGKSLEEMADIAGGASLSAAAFLKAARDPSSIRDLDPEAKDLEGYLFPDTYQVPSTSPEPEKALVQRMVQRFREVIEPERAAVARSGMGLRQVVTLASLVELETARAEERVQIAAVFHNRLAKKMRLQTDPTVIYALRQAGRYDGNIRRKDLEIESPYNTYRNGGLPPGPIASPGLESIRAVLHPAPGSNLYFVSRNDGTHQFSATLVEHNRAVNLYQRGGKPAPFPSGSPGAP